MLLPKLTRRIVNGAWIANCFRAHDRFIGALNQVEATQTRGLIELLRRNAGTQFGRAHQFSRITSVAEYQQRVPLNPYPSLAHYITAIAEGQPNVLTAEPVRLFQPTSGSISGTKLIPWTPAAAREFRRGIDPWVYALYTRKPGLLRGSAYWSISPPSTPFQQHGRLKVGFDHDASYLGFLGKTVFSLVSSVPASVAQCRDMTEFRTRTLLALLADEHLSLISIWSPTFLTTLLKELLGRRDEFAAKLACSRRPQAKRRAEILRAAGDNPESGLLQGVWPGLAVISCWTHGSSEIHAERLRRCFPSVEIQGKGLVATEAFVSFPLREGTDPVLATRSHFFEFQAPDSSRVSLAHELAVGEEYDVIVTTGGGLYRYPLGDRVRVTGFIGEVPCLRFIGRPDLISDLFGEKLHGPFVAEIIQRVMAEQDIRGRFAMLAPVEDEKTRTSYTLFLCAGAIPDSAQLRNCLELGLAENFHYNHCRRLGQLAAARIFHIQQDPASAEEVFVDTLISRGQRAGDIKMAPLDRSLGWEKRFRGQFTA